MLFGQPLMIHEFRAVVRGNGKNKGLYISVTRRHAVLATTSGFLEGVCFAGTYLSYVQSLSEQHFLPLANNEIHFPVTERIAVSFGRALI